MAKVQRSCKLRNSQTEFHSPAQLDSGVLQYHLVHIYSTPLYQGSRLPHRFNSVFSSYGYKTCFQSDKEQHPYTATGREYALPNGHKVECLVTSCLILLLGYAPDSIFCPCPSLIKAPFYDISTKLKGIAHEYAWLDKHPSAPLRSNVPYPRIFYIFVLIYPYSNIQFSYR
jgi:hypothetical protein